MSEYTVHHLDTVVGKSISFHDINVHFKLKAFFTKKISFSQVAFLENLVFNFSVGGMKNL